MEVFRDSSQQLPLKIYVDRTLTNADSSPAVSLKLNGVALPPHSVTQESTGVYVTQLRFADTFEEGELEATWTYAVDSEPVTKIEVHPVITSYADLENLYESSYTDSELRMAEKYARSQIDSYTGQKFGKHKTWTRSQGTGTDILILNERLIEPTHVYENGILVWEDTGLNNAISSLEVTPSGFAIRILDRANPVESSPSGILFPGGRFIEGYTYDVIGEFGYPNVPSNITMCANMLVEDYFCKDRAWREKYASRVSSGDFIVELNSGAFSGTGNSVVDAILSDYMWHRMVVI